MSYSPAKSNTSPRFSANTSDKYELYQISVQSPKEDIEFLVHTYRDLRGKTPRHFREDFCGTALLCCNWTAQGKDFTAEGFDIDSEPLDWGRSHHFAEQKENAQGTVLHQADVRESSDRSPDIRCAQNFSYCVFKKREEMLDYFCKVHADLADDGIFVMDVHGGPECFEEMEEETEQDEGFSYVWDQDEYWPVTGEAQTYIHFTFEDGTEMRRAFSYNWRLWGLPELRDLLTEAGFSKVDCYWEGTDEDDDESGNGIFTRSELGENDLSWISYLVSQK